MGGAIFFLLIVVFLVLYPGRKLPILKPPNFKTKNEIEDMLFHAPAQKAILECRMAGASENSIKKSIRHHEEMCVRRGIGKGNLV